jgi:peptide/nickel transport system permease protein
MKAYYGLDKPINQQFADTVKANIRFDFGNSILYKKPVVEIISKGLPWTFYIMFFTLMISLLIGVFTAILGIYNPKLNRVIHRIMTSVCEVPPFIVGILLLFLIAAKVKWIPLSGNLTPFKKYTDKMDYIKDVLVHGLMPISTLVIINTPRFYFTAVSSFKTILNKQYIENAHSKGLSKRRILIKYILLNAVLPIISKFFLSVGNAIGATMVVENVFAYPGLGKVLRDAVVFRDFILIQGIFLVSTTTVLISSFISDCITEFIAKYNT